MCSSAFLRCTEINNYQVTYTRCGRTCSQKGFRNPVRPVEPGGRVIRSVRTLLNLPEPLHTNNFVFGLAITGKLHKTVQLSFTVNAFKNGLWGTRNIKMGFSWTMCVDTITTILSRLITGSKPARQSDRKASDSDR